MYSLDLLFFYLDTLIRDDIAEKSHSFLMELTLLEVGI